MDYLFSREAYSRWETALGERERQSLTDAMYSKEYCFTNATMTAAAIRWWYLRQWPDSSWQRYEDGRPPPETAAYQVFVRDESDSQASSDRVVHEATFIRNEQEQPGTTYVIDSMPGHDVYRCYRLDRDAIEWPPPKGFVDAPYLERLFPGLLLPPRAAAAPGEDNNPFMMVFTHWCPATAEAEAD